MDNRANPIRLSVKSHHIGPWQPLASLCGYMFLAFSGPDSAAAQPKSDNQQTLGNSATIAVADSLCMIVKDGKVACTIDDKQDRLYYTYSDVYDSDKPQPPIIKKQSKWRLISGLRDVVALSAGMHFVCALTREGRVSCWGETPLDDEKPRSWLFGTGSPADRWTARPVPGLTGKVLAISAESHGLCARLPGGAIKCIHPVRGDIDWRGFGIKPAQVSAILGRENGRCILSTAGLAKCLLWFENRDLWWDGGTAFSEPLRLLAFTGGGETATTISGLTRRDRVDMCNGNGEDKPGCTQIANLPKGIVDLRRHCARTQAGEIWCWGENIPEGHPEATKARLMALPEPAIDLSVGIRFPCARLTSGSAACFLWRNPMSAALAPGAIVFAPPDLH